MHEDFLLLKFMQKEKGNIFLAVSLILLGILGVFGKLYTHVGEWKVGQIVKLILIGATSLVGVYLLIRKKTEK